MVKRLRLLLGLLLVLLVGLSLTVNNHLVKPYRPYILSEHTLYNQPIEAIVVLGSLVEDGEPLPVVRERLDTAAYLYDKGLSRRIIVSGHGGIESTSEVQVMKNYLMEQGIPSYRIFIDHDGQSTYRSMLSLKEVFNLKNVIIVSQKYHLPRAIFLGRQNGIEAYGYSAAQQKKTSYYQQVREYFARNKDYVQNILKPKQSFIQENINIEWSGDITNRP